MTLPAAERRRRRRDWRMAALVGIGLAGLVLVEQQLLIQSRSLPIGRDAVFLALVHLNVFGILTLVYLLGRNVVKLVVDRRRGIFGSRLTTKFVTSFGLVAALSSVGLFGLSGFLVWRAISLWSELELSQSLGQSVEIAEAYYTEAETQSLHFARRISAEVGERRLLREDALDELGAFVAAKRAEYDLGVVEVFSAQLEELATATHPEVAVVAFEGPDSRLVAAGLAGQERTIIDHAGPGELIRAAVPVHSSFKAGEVVGVVVVNRFVPRGVGVRVEAIHRAIAAYDSLQLNEGTFQGSMLVLLAMISLVALLFSTWIGFRLAKQITEPIQRLAGATAEVAAGNLDVRLEQRGDDEIGELVADFNRMATDLSVSREDLEQRRSQMEIILRSVGTGVISLDRDGVVQTINPSALRLLGVGRNDGVGRKLEELLEGASLETANDLLYRLASGVQETRQRQVTVPVQDEVRTLNWTASRIRDVDGDAAGFVVVLDDVTQFLAVQRMAAWREVARRIAHEIKNPLTPIQLSAQRLRRKLASRLETDDAEVLEECTTAITDEVEGMKNLLAEFSNFARMPATDPAPTDLNKLVSDAVAMYRGNATIHFATDLADDVPLLDLDREQMKRVILNLVDNAMAAIEEAGPGPREISLRTRYERGVGIVFLEITDTGTGIPDSDRVRLFEPYYSTKHRGSGLGLAIVSRIVSDHSGYIRVRTNTPRGARFIVELPARP